MKVWHLYPPEDARTVFEILKRNELPALLGYRFIAVEPGNDFTEQMLGLLLGVEGIDIDQIERRPARAHQAFHRYWTGQNGGPNPAEHLFLMRLEGTLKSLNLLKGGMNG